MRSLRDVEPPGIGRNIYEAAATQPLRAAGKEPKAPGGIGDNEDLGIVGIYDVESSRHIIGKPQRREPQAGLGIEAWDGSNVAYARLGKYVWGCAFRPDRALPRHRQGYKT